MELSFLQSKYRHYADPFLRSAHYLSYLSKGAISRFDGEYPVHFFKHPLKENHNLILPPVCTGETKTLLKLMREQEAGGEWSVIRCDRFAEERVCKVFNRQKHVAARAVRDKSLDFAYPAPVLSLEKTVKAEGKVFSNVRNRLTKMNSIPMSCRMLESSDMPAVEGLLRNASRPSAHPFDVLSFSGSGQGSSCEGLMGLGLFFNEKLQAVQFVEASCRGAYVHFSATSASSKELPTVAQYRFCQFLREKGFRWLNLGSSQTYGQHSFKKNFGPVREIRLKSVHLNPKS